MKKLLLLLITCVMILSLMACSNQAQETEIQTTEPTEQESQATQESEGWSYNSSTKTLFVNVDMGAFEPDAPDFEGTTSNAPWAEFLPEIENIVASDEVTFIGDYTFAFCPNLKKVEVGKNVGALNFRAFFKCGDFDNDSSIDMYFNSTPSFGEDAFGYTWDNPNVVVFVPDDMKEHWAQYLMQKGSMNLDGYVYEPQNMDEVIHLALNNPRPLEWEGIELFTEHSGGQLAKGNVKREYGDEKMTLISGKKPAKVPLMTKLGDFMGTDGSRQQAIVVKFQPKDASDISFKFEDRTEFSFDFEDDDIYFNDIDNKNKVPFSDCMPNDFELKSSENYYFFFAFDDEAYIRTLVWEEDNYSNNASYEASLYSDDDDIYDSNWKMTIGFGANQQFSVYQYAGYTFEDFIKPTTTEEIVAVGEQASKGKDDVLYSMLMKPQELWSEGSGGFAENNGGEFGGGVKMGYNADLQRLEIFGEDAGACAQFNTSIQTCMSDIGMERIPQQAVMVKFSASDITNGVRFSFNAMDEITFSFRSDGIYFVDVANFSEMTISDFIPNNLELKNDTTYYYFFAFDAQGDIRMFIWEDGLAENQAYFEYDLYQESADINSCDLMMYLGVGASEQFNIYEYWVYTFDSFMDNPLG